MVRWGVGGEGRSALSLRRGETAYGNDTAKGPLAGLKAYA